MRNLIIGASVSAVSILGLLAIMAMTAPAVDNSPVGTIIAWAGDEQSVPADWMICDGKVLDKKQYPALNQAIGNTWGAPKKTKFNLPDLRGRFIRGADLGSGRDPDADEREAANKGGSKSGVGSVQQSSLQNHSHDTIHHSHEYVRFSPLSTQIQVTLVTGGDKDVITSAQQTPYTTLEKAKVDIAGAWEYGTESPLKTGEEVRPKNAAVKFIIKVK